ncbi:type II toxin-antitoxin system VapC family toxin [Agrococcus sp. KRD186]|uniref:type II toxin-antitoxin system VapC family toxin n=1 Tax=Agrococcus sp. KRD186 TaxID=2729730 RepID=UPI00237C0B41|nr:type II toxin-antitoxin system VapC family toxin [Agrococcus sp. KRD186]
MIACFDTSAIVPLLIEEPASASCERVWRDATRVHIASITVAETAAALAQARRIGRIDGDALQIALRGADQLWQRCAISPITVGLAREAAELAVLHDLRGFDAVQCAFGLALAEAGAIGVAGDRALLTAWRTAGMPVLDITR